MHIIALSTSGEFAMSYILRIVPHCKNLLGS